MKQLCIENQDQTATFMLFEPATLSTYYGHSLEKDTPVIAVAWSSDGQHIASAGFDSTVQIWDAVTGEHVLTYRGHSAEIFTVAWSPSGSCIAFASCDGIVRVLHVE